MATKVVHFSSTRLAGAPIRIVRALQNHSEYDVRMVDTERWGTFDQDHVHAEDPDQTVALAEEADIIHLYNYLDLNSQDFAPLDFRDLWNKGKRFVRHFQSTPATVAERMKIDVADVHSCPIPKIAIAQYPERFLPTARVVPNIVPQDTPEYSPSGEDNIWDIVYSPSRKRGAWQYRWDTKGMPETLAMLRNVEHRCGARVKCINGRPLSEVMAEKRRSLIVVDELVTGSYHLSALEGLSLGKAVVAFLDERTHYVLRSISGSPECPFVSTRLEDAEEVLCHLVSNPDETIELGLQSRAWIDKYWREQDLVTHFDDVYRTLLDDPTRLVRQPELRIDSPRARFTAVAVPDLVYTSRRRTYEEHGRISKEHARLSKVQGHILVRTATKYAPLYDKITAFVKRFLPGPLKSFVIRIAERWCA